MANRGWAQIHDLQWITNPKSREEVIKFRSGIEFARAYAQQSVRTSVEILSVLFEQSGLSAYARQCDTQQASVSALPMVDMLEMMLQFAMEYPLLHDFASFYHQQMLQEEETGSKKHEEEDTDRVSIRTIHKCKGDEFLAVVLYHVVEGVLPHRKAVEMKLESAIEEERRIFYVGMTRATERLLITTESKRPSRFLKELDHPKYASLPHLTRQSNTQQSRRKTMPQEQPAGCLVSLFSIIRMICILLRG